MSEDWGRTLEDTRALATDAGGNLVRRRAIVRVADGPQAGLEVELARESLVVGSGASADLVLSDPRVSRLHAELSLGSQGVRVRDLGSRNGTFVGEARVGAIVVPFGSRVRLGRTTLELRAADEAVALPPAARTSFGAMVGASVATRSLFALLEQLAPTDAPVLLHGETGVGKTAAALALHAASGRTGEARFVDVTLGPDEEALAAELARPGTVVLEHVDRASAETAAALASVLEARERGSACARILSTTRDDPRALVEAGAFSRDLFFHLAVVRVHLLPLRDRPDDVPLLVEALAPKNLPVPHDELDRLRADGYPGNVRSLKAVLEASVGLARAAPGDLAAPPPPSAATTFHEAKQQVVERFERDYLARLLEEHDGNVSQAARTAGVARSHFITLLQKHGLA